MAKAVYVGVGSKARKMKKAYIGIGGTARKVKKMYIGDSSGKARLCYSAELEKTGTAEKLGIGGYDLGAAGTAHHALFAGRQTSYKEASSYVDAYDVSLTHTAPTSLSVARGVLGAATVGGRALFAGGGYYGAYGSLHSMTAYYKGNATVDAYDDSLTRTTAANLSEARIGLSGASVGKYALFGGGYTGKNGYIGNGVGFEMQYIYKSVVDAYDESLTRTTATALSKARNCTGVTVGGYALFAGGTGSNVVDVYNTSLTRTTASSLSASGVVYGATTIGRYALIGIGDGTVNVYDTSLTRTTAASLSASRTLYSSANIGDYALFAGGYNSSYYSTVDAYDSSLVRTTATSLNTARYGLAAATVGDYAIFAGGKYDSNSAVVDVYTA
mgnify:CR=1 FL=1